MKKKFKNPRDIVDIVIKILVFNNQNQEEQGLKILTSDQVLSRLPITLTLFKAGHNSGKFKNEIRKLLFFVSFKDINQKYLW